MLAPRSLPDGRMRRAGTAPGSLRTCPGRRTGVLERILGLGGIAVSTVIVILGLRVLPFPPESPAGKADKADDPYGKQSSA